MHLPDDAIEPLIESVTSKTSIAAGGVTSIWGVFTQDFVFGVLGILIAVLTMGINWYYKNQAKELDAELKLKDDQRKERLAQLTEEEHVAKMQRFYQNQELD